MKPSIRVEMNVGTLAAITPPQLEALQRAVLADGCWEQAQGLYIAGHAGSYLGVEPLDSLHSRLMFIGIEPDGYTHT